MAPDDTLRGDAHEAELQPRPEVVASRPPPGKLETFAVLGACVGTVPLPWLPDALARRLRGALVQDIAARHGLALTSDARRMLADPGATKTKRGALGQAFGFLSKKVLVRFGPLALLPPLRAAIETYVLGYLFDRYLARDSRPPRTRVDEDEARVVRQAIERAVLRVVSPEGGLQWPVTPLPPEESRDEITQALDGLLSATTTIPAWLLDRLATAFDETLAHEAP
jgi:hypothetical protein